MHNQKDLETALNEVRKKFPETRAAKITLAYSPYHMHSNILECQQKKAQQFHIDVGKIMGFAPKSALRGGLSHELGHISVAVNHTMKWYKKDINLYDKNDHYAMLDERNTDLLAVTHGFGRDLLSFFRYCEKLGYVRTSETGLSMKELQMLVRK